MSLITHDGQKAFLIPDDSRGQYFTLVDQISQACRSKFRNTNYNDVWDATNDPIVIIDLSQFTFENAKRIQDRMQLMGAKDITETLI